MSDPTGKLFTLKTRHNNIDPPWETWHSTFVIWPRRSIMSKFVFGRVNRSSRDAFKVPFGTYLGDNEPKRFHRYATNKELFIARLAGEEGE